MYLSYFSLLAGTKYLIPRVKGGAVYLAHSFRGFRTNQLSQAWTHGRGAAVHGGREYQKQQERTGEQTSFLPL